MNAKEIQKLICTSEVLKFNFCCENVKYIFSDEEIDVLSINKNSYITEYEVKISKADFKADAKKKKSRWYIQKIESMTANYYYYVCPDGLIKEEELPFYAGLIYVVNGELKYIKGAPMLHKHKKDYNRIVNKLLRVYCERTHLGSCRMTYENKKSQAAYDKYQKTITNLRNQHNKT